ncbi:Oidioi.mRNA.OKI2018_I69.XSR.g15623.t1.cds [Oikopleura dioica]|uniref:GINS complex subunit 2 n=1 Tax=Oikopleura dioica TaxID=34765 RepID=A0ABN7SHM9_OIKDI|nr:Oidioi.mRNA.OKI2018_I69.XSR.g15623.t1.cds [Oikopleura dioica]
MNGSVAFEDIEFLSEDELLKITPKFREARLQMISGEFGPFTPGVPLKVPAWMAINLVQRNLCIVHQPAWLSVAELQKWYEAEKNEEQNAVNPVHYNYRELSRLLLRHCRDGFKDVDQLDQLIEDLWNIRVAKLRVSCQNVLKTRWQMEIADHGGVYKISNFTQLEVNFIRQAFLHSLKVSFTISNKITDLEQKSAQHFDATTITSTTLSQKTI